MGPELETQSFARYEVGVEISIKILVLTLDYFQEKVMTNFFKKSKKTYFGAMWPFWPFLPKFGEDEFFWKIGSVNFQIFQLFTIVPKIRKN